MASYNRSMDDSDYEGYEICNAQSSALPFDQTAIEKLVLMISDKFDFKVVLSDDRTRKAMLVTTGLTLAGGILGRHYGGNMGALVGGAVGGACGLGLVVVTMRDIWSEIRSKLSELFDVVYDYIAGLGIEDYKKAAQFLLMNKSNGLQLAMLIVDIASGAIGKQIMSSITAA